PWFRLGGEPAFPDPPEGSQECLLPPAPVSRFAIRVYLSRLAERPVDVLALLHYFNRAVLPAKVGGRYSAVSLGLLLKMFFRAPWPGNAHELLNSLVTSAVRDSRRVAQRKRTDTANLGVLCQNPDLPLFNPGKELPPESYESMDRSERLGRIPRLG